MSECEDQEHHMGYVIRQNGLSWGVWNDEDFSVDRKLIGFTPFNFCPNCGKELKEFYEEE